MNIWYDTINERQFYQIYNKDLLSYILDNNLSVDDIEFMFDDGHNEYNEDN